MAKHEVNHHIKRKQKSSNLTLIAVLLIVAVLVIGGLYFFKPLLEKNKYDTYNAFEFEKSGEFWQTYVEYNKLLTPITFYNHPLDLEKVPFDEEITSYILEKPHSSFVIAVRNDVGSIPVIAGVNMARILGGRFYGFDVTSALYYDDLNVSNSSLPVTNCDQATLYEPVIFIDVGSENNSITFSEENDNCILITSESTDKEDVLAMSDLFVYKILEIM